MGRKVRSATVKDRFKVEALPTSVERPVDDGSVIIAINFDGMSD